MSPNSSDLNKIEVLFLVRVKVGKVVWGCSSTAGSGIQVLWTTVLPPHAQHTASMPRLQTASCSAGNLLAFLAPASKNTSQLKLSHVILLTIKRTGNHSLYSGCRGPVSPETRIRSGGSSGADSEPSWRSPSQGWTFTSFTLHPGVLSEVRF